MRCSLKPAQLRVLELFLKGLLEKQVAEKLGISQHTVHNHAREIYRAYRVHTRPELLLQALPHPTEGRATVVGELPTAME
ncbi:MAG: response regulator transcription factor [Planctomycetaceae bacterium]